MSQVQTYAYGDWVRFPDLTQDRGSLTPLERSLLGNIILLVRPRLIVELGVFRAVTTQFICDFLHANEIEASVVGFEFPDVVADLRRGNAAVAEYESMSRLQLMPGRLPVSLQDWLQRLDQPIDLAFVDATHDYPSVWAELSLLWPRLSPDGCILCHDYSSNFDGVRHAVDRFAAKVGARVMPLTASETARLHGHTSVLVALRPPTFKPTMRSMMSHRWKKAKADWLGYVVINKLWHQGLRPLMRRGAHAK